MAALNFLAKYAVVFICPVGLPKKSTVIDSFLLTFVSISSAIAPPDFNCFSIPLVAPFLSTYFIFHFALELKR